MQTHATLNCATDLEVLQSQGYVILKDVMGERRRQAISAELEPWFEKTPRCEGDFYGWRTTRIGGLLSKAPTLHDLVLHPYILAIAETLLLPSCDVIQLNLTQASRVHPGEEAQAPHRDEEMWPCVRGERPWLINVIWALDDFTCSNGATRLWPGSHLHALDRNIDRSGSIAAEMPAGSALIFLGALTHGAGKNESAKARTGIIVSYSLGWLKTYENQFLAYAREEALRFPEALQRLIGYQMHKPNLGGVDGQDPILALREPGIVRPHKDALPPHIETELLNLRRGDGAIAG